MPVPCSGIITQQFKEIRQTVMDTVLETFFDAHFLGNYVQTKAAQLEDSNYLSALPLVPCTLQPVLPRCNVALKPVLCCAMRWPSVVRKIREVLESPETDAMLTKHVEAIFTRPEGMCARPSLLPMHSISASCRGRAAPMLLPGQCRWCQCR